MLAEDLHTMSRILPIPRTLIFRGNLRPPTPKLFLIANIPLVSDRLGASGLQIARRLLNTPKSVPHMASEQERLGTSTGKDLRVLCYQHHTEMLIRLLSEPREGVLYACREPGCLVRYDSSHDTSSTQEMQRLSNKKPRLGSGVPMMGNSCISLG